MENNILGIFRNDITGDPKMKKGGNPRELAFSMIVYRTIMIDDEKRVSSRISRFFLTDGVSQSQKTTRGCPENKHLPSVWMRCRRMGCCDDQTPANNTSVAKQGNGNAGNLGNSGNADIYDELLIITIKIRVEDVKEIRDETRMQAIGESSPKDRDDIYDGT